MEKNVEQKVVYPFQLRDLLLKLTGLSRNTILKISIVIVRGSS